jgi:hypothetical protein
VSQVSPEAYEAIKRELQDKERALADMSVELAILQKNDLGFVEPISGTWLKAQTKLEILNVIASSQQQDVSARHSCSLLLIEHRRVVRWQQQARQGQSLANLRPGPQDPLHRVRNGD